MTHTDPNKVMSYNLMNRRDTVTKHHSSVADSEATIKDYLAIGAPASKLNLGFAYYAKYFTTQGDCSSSPLNCPIVLAEDAWGKDTLTSGAWTFEKPHMHPVDTSALTVAWDGTCGLEKGTKCGIGCCSQHGHCGTSPEHCSGACQHAFGTGCTDAVVAASWQLATKHGITDEAAGGQYYFDAQNRLFWTWDTPELTTRKFKDIVRNYKLGGIMAWSLGEDSADWSHIRHMAREVAKSGFGLAAASDSILPTYGLVEAVPPARTRTSRCVTTQNLPPTPTQHDAIVPETPSPSCDVIYLECWDNHMGMARCPPDMEFPPYHTESGDGNGSVQYVLNEDVNFELDIAPQDPNVATPAAEVETSTTFYFEAVSTVEPEIITNIGIPLAQEIEFSGGSPRVRRRERAQKA
jgi:hypothetical protein